MSQREEISGSLEAEARQRRSERQKCLLEAQRADILRAIGEEIAEHGLLGTSVPEVARRAFVSSKTFERLFGSLEGCFATLVEQTVEQLMQRICEQSERAWQDGVISGLRALLSFLDVQPSLAQVLLVEAMAHREAFEVHMLPALKDLATFLDQAVAQLPAGEQPPALTGEGTVFAIAGILRLRLTAGAAPPFVDLLGELAALAVAPYLGMAEAARVSKQSMEGAVERKHEPLQPTEAQRLALPPQLRRATAHQARTVLRYVAANPGVSNKHIGRATGIEHLGQVSTLLGRLERAGLLVKQVGGPGRPNAWTLSSQGEAAASALGHG